MAGWVLAIDFGTSYTTVAIAENGRVELIDVDGVRALPSGVWLDGSGALVVGTSAERQSRLAPERWERSPKRLLGEVAPLLLGGHRIAVVDAVAAVLRHVAAEAMRRQGGRPDEVRLTYPARWGERRRGGLQTAAGIAGLGIPVVAHPPRLVPEPVAAALYFAGHGQLPVGAQVAVYDLGGGTFDTTVLAADQKGFSVRALGGLDGTGGESFDALLYTHVGQLLAGRDPYVWESLQAPPDVRWRRAGEDLYREVRRAKEDLSRYASVTLDTESIVGVPLQLTRDEIESVLRPRIEATARELAETIRRTGQRPDQMAAVYLAGGSSRMPLVERVVSDMLQVTASVLGEPKSVVAAGAARWTGGIPVEVPKQSTQRALDAKLGAAAEDKTVVVDRMGDTIRDHQPDAATDEITGIADGRTGFTYSFAQRWPRSGPRWPLPVPIVAVVAILLAGFGTAAFLASRSDPKPTILATPTNVKAAGTSESVLLSWDAVPRADHYVVTRDSSIRVFAGRGTKATDVLDDRLTHTYVVYAVDRSGVTSGLSEPVSGRLALSAAQQALVDRLRANLVNVGSCRANTDFTEYSKASVICRPTGYVAPPAILPSAIYAYQEHDHWALEQHLKARHEFQSFQGTDCARPPAMSGWNQEGDPASTIRGHYYCYTDGFRASLDWTNKGETILLAAALTSTDTDGLFQWWLTVPGPLKPK